MRQIYLLAVLLFTLNAYCQIGEYRPTFQEYEMTKLRWTSMDSDSQIARYEDGTIKVEYESIKDSIKLKKEYFKNGQLKLTCEVKQIWGTDTIYTKDPITLKDTAIYISGYVDSPFGRYIEYFKEGSSGYDNYDYQTKGQLIGGRKVAQWERVFRYEKRIFGTYNSKGDLDGAYVEYAFDLDKRGYKDTIWSGKYVPVELMEERKVYFWQNGSSNWIKKKVNTTKSFRSGIWRFYNKNGELLQKVEYRWVNK